MYFRDNNKLKVFVLLSLFFWSCNQTNSKQSGSRHKEINPKYNKYVIDNFEVYSDVYDQIQDSLLVWSTKNLKFTRWFQFGTYQIDSLIVVNLAKDRLYTTMNFKCYSEQSHYDDIHGFRGHKIDGKWYFTMGAAYTVLRSNYTDDTQYPFTFEQLSYLARTKYIGRFLKENEQGELVPNEEKFQDYFVNGFAGPDSKLEEIEAFIKKKIYYYHRDTLDQATIDDITQDVAKRKAAVLSAPPREYEKTSPPKLFDREAWKNRHKVDKE